MLKFVLSSLLVLGLFFIGTATFAQTGDTTAQKKSAPPIKIFDDRTFNGIRVGVDGAGIAFGYIVNDEYFTVKNRYEINADFGIKKWFVTLDLGTGTFERNFTDTISSSPYQFTNDGVYNNSGQYTSTGQYFRIGGDYRISKSAKSFLFFGGRFGKAFISEKATVEIPGILTGNDLTPARPYLERTEVINRNLSANWLEIATGVKTHIWKNIYLGYTLRFKLLLPSKKVKEEQPLDIPGFGVANKNNNLGMSFHIMYRIPFGKDPIIPLKGR